MPRILRGEALANAIYQVTDKLEEEFAEIFIAEVRKLSRSKALQQLLDEIEAGQLAGAGLTSRLSIISIPTKKLDELIRKAMGSAIRITNEKTGLKFSFDYRNPDVIQAARGMSIELSTNLSKTAQQILEKTIGDAIEGIITRREAIKIIESRVGLIPAHADAVDRYYQRLIAEGRKKADAKSLADKYADRLLRYRATTIARTEIARATGIGQSEFWKQAVADGLLPPKTKRVWITAADERVCEICGAMDGKQVEIGQPWMTQNGLVQYPSAAHPNCRCTQGIALSKDYLKMFRSEIAERQEIIEELQKIDSLKLDWWLISKKNPYHDESGRFTSAGRAVAPKGKKPKLKRDGSKTKSAGGVFKRALKQVESLSYDNAIGIRDYSVMGFREINASLRKSNGKKIIRKTERMDRSFALGSITLDQDVVVYRGAPLSVPAINRMLGEKTLVVGKYGDIQAGKPKRTNFTDHGFASTTIDEERARRHSSEPTGGAARGGKNPINVLFKITVKKGSRVLAGTFRGGQEKELVLNRGTKYKVVSVSTGGFLVLSANKNRSYGTFLVEVEAVSP